MRLKKKNSRYPRPAVKNDIKTIKPSFGKSSESLLTRRETPVLQPNQRFDQGPPPPVSTYSAHSTESAKTLFGVKPETIPYHTNTVNRNSVQQLKPSTQQPTGNPNKNTPPPMPTEIIVDSRGKEFCVVKKGEYFIGLENEHKSLKAPFALGKYAVTKDEYLQFVIEEKIDYSSEEIETLNRVSPYPNSPAVMVSWQDAKAYCRWLRRKTGDYYALPSITEWESAARGKAGKIYPWGQEEPNLSICCFADNNTPPLTTSTVDYYTQNISQFGCIGMVGNVMEWTLDSFDDERDLHILKGGSWMHTKEFCNNVTPLICYPSDRRWEFVGLRILYLPNKMYREYKLAHQ